MSKENNKIVLEKKCIDIINNIYNEAIEINKNGESMNCASWGYEEGILLTGDEAIILYTYFKKHIKP